VFISPAHVKVVLNLPLYMIGYFGYILTVRYVVAAVKEPILRIEAPCKINVHLRVKDLREDGYHNLESIFVPLAFGDTLWVERTDEAGECTLVMDGRELMAVGQRNALSALQGEHNSVYRALSLFRTATGFQGGIQVRVQKRIPLGGGLGGGSSDAASMLRALRVLVVPDLPRVALQEMALALGSDVLFFLGKGAAWVSGRGERVLPLKAPQKIWVVLVYPGFPSDTAGAFRLLDRARSAPGGEPEADERRDLVEALEGEPDTWPYKNDFLRVFLQTGDQEQAAVYRGVVQELKALGADFAGLSGAGSTCFGIFKREGAAREAVISLSTGNENRGCGAVITFPLAYLVNEGVE
jgi:4-diphosphocytidyl-2-C-methyl-D-erythritol kinase